MKIRTYAFDAEGSFEVLEVDPPPTRAALDERVRWVSVEDATGDTLVEICESLNMSEDALDAVTSPGQRALYAPYEDVVIVRAPFLPDLESGRVRILTILCFPRTVVTLHEGPQPALAQFVTEFEADRAHPEPTVGSLVVHMLDVQVERSIALVLRNRDEIIELEDRIGDDDQDPGELNHEVAVRKRETVRLVTAVEDQYWAARAVDAAEARQLRFEGAERVLANAIANADYGQRVLERQERRLLEARQELQIRVHDLTDGRLQVLTIISAVFLPLSLITGIYGMNFNHMPGSGVTNGFWFTMASMGALALGMMFVFKRRGWY